MTVLHLTEAMEGEEDLITSILSSDLEQLLEFVKKAKKRPELRERAGSQRRRYRISAISARRFSMNWK